MTKQNILHKSKLQKAEKALAAGKINEAGNMLTQLCKKDPENITAWLLLASVYGRISQFQGVIECTNKVLSIQPNNATALNYLGNAYTATKQYSNAINCYERFLYSNREDIGTLYNLAFIYFKLNRFSDATTVLKQVTTLNPKHINALNLLYEIHKDDYTEATKICEKLTELKPDNYALLYKLAHHYMSLLEIDKAKKTFLKCLKLTSEPAMVYVGLSDNELNGNQENNFIEAEKYLRLALKNDPNNIKAKFSEVNLWFRQGDKPEAQKQLEAIINNERIKSNDLIMYSSLFSQLGYGDYIVEQGLKLLNNPASMPTNICIELHYRLGRILDKSKQYQDAFSHYKKANELENVKYEIKPRTETTNKTINAYTSEDLKQLSTSTIDSDLPVFIVGMPRSGSTLVEQILASHSDIFGAGELMEMSFLNSEYLSSSFNYQGEDHGHAKNLNTQQLNTLAQYYIDKLESFSTSALRITDKMPHNSLMLGFITQLFPKAKIINCTRHPIDTILSIYFQHFTKAHDFSFNLESIAEYYLEHERLMKHWKETLNTPIYDVPYDNIVNNFENTCRDLVKFTELEWQEQCLEFYKSKRSVNTPSHDQVNQPIYISSIDRWKNYEEQLKPLKKYFPELLS